MRRNLSILLCIFMIMQFFTFSDIKVKASGITLKSITLDNRTIAPKEALTISVDFSTPNDLGKAYYYVDLTYVDPNGVFQTYSIWNNGGIFSTKTYNSDIQQKGLYELVKVRITDGHNSTTYVNKDLNIYNIAGEVAQDFSNYSFEFQGTPTEKPILKNITFSHSQYHSNQWAKIRLEAEWIKSLGSAAEITMLNKEKNINSDRIILTKVDEVASDGVYKAVYEGTYNHNQETNWTGTWIPSLVNLFCEGINIAWRHSTTVQRSYTLDFNSSSFRVTADKEPGPKLIRSSINSGAANVPHSTAYLELYFDKELQRQLYGFTNNISLTGTAGDSIPVYKEQEGKTLRLRLDSPLKKNSKYYLNVKAMAVLANDGSVNESDINVLNFSTGSEASVAEGIKNYVTENKSFTTDTYINGDLIIATGKNLSIKAGAKLEVNGNIIVYGSLVNEGNIKVSGNMFIQQESKQVTDVNALWLGTFVNKGTMENGNIIVKNYPKPMFYLTPETSGDIDASKVEFTIITYPFLMYSINDKYSTIPNDGVKKDTVALRYGRNELSIMVEDPFGNAKQKIVNLNNISTAIKVISAFPQDDYIKLPINTPVYLKLDREVVAGPGMSNIILINDKGRMASVEYSIEGNEVVFYPSGADFSYNTTYTISIPDDALMDTKGNYLERHFKATFSTDKEFTVLGGKDRYDTSLKISKEGWVKADYAVLATGSNFPDALSAAPLAAKYAAPILLVKSKELDSALEQELNRLGVKQVFIIGGTGVVSQNIENKIKAKGIKVVRIYGKDRYETSVAIAKQLGVNQNTTAFLVTGENFPDALSVASIAAAYQMPIILTQKTKLPVVTKQFFAETKISKFYIIGGYGVIANSLEGLNATWAKRISGNNRYETNLNVLAEFQEYLDFTYTFFATGKNFPDALSGSALAGMALAPVILVDPAMPSNVITGFRGARREMKMKYLLGGESVVPKSVVERITK